MARQQQAQANQAFGSSQNNNALAGQNAAAANNLASGANAQSSQLFNSLFPTVQGDISNPQGYGQGDMAAMNTAVGQAAGGAAGAAAHRGDLTAARTRNIGGAAAGADEAARQGMATNAAGALSVQGKNADLKSQQRAAAIKEQSNMLGMSQDETLKAMGLSNQALGEGNAAVNSGVGAIDAGTQAGKSGWFQNMLATISALNPSGKAGGVSFGG